MKMSAIGHGPKARMARNPARETAIAETKARNAALLAEWKAAGVSRPHSDNEADWAVKPDSRRFAGVVDKAKELNQEQYVELVAGKKTGLSAFGMSEDAWKAMVEAQDGKCAICETKTNYAPSLAVDHCHETGKVRGLLCRACNTGLGQFRDNPELLSKAIQYLNGSRKD